MDVSSPKTNRSSVLRLYIHTGTIHNQKLNIIKLPLKIYISYKSSETHETCDATGRTLGLQTVSTKRSGEFCINGDAFFWKTHWLVGDDFIQVDLLFGT